MSDMKKLMFTEVKLIYSIAILKSEPKSEFKLCKTQILSRVFAREILEKYILLIPEGENRGNVRR